MGDSLEASETGSETQNLVVVELKDFINYVRHAAQVLLPEDDGHSESPALTVALEDKNNLDCLAKFIGESQASTLFIQRNSSKGIVIISIFIF